MQPKIQVIKPLYEGADSKILCVCFKWAVWKTTSGVTFHCHVEAWL